MAGLILISAAAGCQNAADRPTASDANGSDVSLAAGQPTSPIDLRESWEAVLIRGSQVGFNHNTMRRIAAGASGNDAEGSRADSEGTARWEIDSVTQLTMRRFGERTVNSTRTKSIEFDDGRVESLEIETRLGANPVVARGQVRGDQLELRTLANGRETVVSLPWPDDCRGFLGVEQSLERTPLQPGEQRRLRIFLPFLNAPADVQLVAAGRERTELLDSQAELLRVEMQIRLPQGAALDSTLWIDERGQTLKSRMQAIGQEAFRTTRERALAESSDAAVAFDLGIDAIVKLARPLERPHEPRERRYRVTLAGGNPAAEFSNAETQRVESLDDHRAEIVVRPAAPSATPGDDPPTPADRLPSEWIQSDDPRIVDLARQARGDETDPWRVALALERWVHSAMREVNFSQAFASAAEVAESREGDCTEHAVLLAALARANGIPARVAIGLVYVERYQGFGYHMWTEINLNDRWLPLDATLGRGGTGGGHLKLSHTSLSGGGALESLVPVAKILGRVAIEVVDPAPR